MKYADLAKLLQVLECGFRSRSVGRQLAIHSSHLRIRDLSATPPGMAHNIQHFALSNTSAEAGAAVPIVILVGINYTQEPSKIPDQTTTLYAKALSTAPWIEDDVNDFEKAYLRSYHQRPGLWKEATLASRELPDSLLLGGDKQLLPYHLVMTNLSPWITTDSWSLIDSRDGSNITADLLASPPSGAHTGLRRPFEHIHELKEALAQQQQQPVVWIGHGRDAVWEHFRVLMRQMGVENWMLTGNLGYPMRKDFLERANQFGEEYRCSLEAAKEKILDSEE